MSKLKPGIAAVIAAHPARIHNGMLNRALGGVWAQTLPVAEVHIAVDLEGEGAGAAKQRALDAVQVEWTAVGDSDDEWLERHLRACFDHAQSTGADFVFPWYEPVGPSGEPRPDPIGHFGLEFNPATPHHTTTTVFVRTELARRVGFASAPAGSSHANDDWHFTLGIAAIAAAGGAKMVHLPERTWRWYLHTGNTCGMPHIGDAA